MIKKGKTEFVIEENDSLVRAALACNGKIILDYENMETKTVRVIAPLPTKENLLETAIYMVQNDSRHKDVSEWIDFYIRCREKEIYEQVQEIRKAVKRLCKKQQCIQIAQAVKQKYEQV